MRQTLNLHFVNFICINCKCLRTVGDVQPENTQGKPYKLCDPFTWGPNSHVQHDCQSPLSPYHWGRRGLTLVRSWPVPRELRWWMLQRLLAHVGLGGPLVVGSLSPSLHVSWHLQAFEVLPWSNGASFLTLNARCWGHDTDCPRSFFSLERLIIYDSNVQRAMLLNCLT